MQLWRIAKVARQTKSRCDASNCDHAASLGEEGSADGRLMSRIDRPGLLRLSGLALTIASGTLIDCHHQLVSTG
jgi:hypothetical protein